VSHTIKMRDIDMYRYPYEPLDYFTPHIFVSSGLVILLTSSVITIIYGPTDTLMTTFLIGLVLMFVGSFCHVRYLAERDALETE
jgi:hypothetical protein